MSTPLTRLAGMAAGTALGVAFALAATAQPADARVTGQCGRLLTQPAYSYTYQGATVREPDGRALYRELREDGVTGQELRTACRVLVREYRQHKTGAHRA